jgi:hypothetical protein
MKRVLPILIWMGFLCPAIAQDLVPQDVDPKKFANTITVGELREHLYVLASDEYEGRETAEKGQKMAAEYLANEFRTLGLPTIGDDSSYFQKVPLIRERWEEVSISVNGQDFKFLEDFYAFARWNIPVDITLNDLVFLGYGIDGEKYSDYDAMDVKGKAIVIFHSEPIKNGISHVTGLKGKSVWSQDRTKKIEFAHQKGVTAVFHVVTNIDKKLKRFKKHIVGKSMRLNTGEPNRFAPNFFISEAMAEAMLAGSKMSAAKAKGKIDKKGKPISFPLAASVKVKTSKSAEEVETENVLGFIEGSDLKDEVIVLTAHYDHIGVEDSLIFNGADDDGSGTVALLEIAEAFQQAKLKGMGPRRSILVMPVSGEEKGLLGSRYYANNPVLPIEATIANLNVDMIGRIDEAHEGNPYYVYIIGSNMISTDLHNINEEANARFTNMQLDYKFNSLTDSNRFYYRSDHYNFAKKGVPVIFYFNGTHEDYHEATDTVEKIHYDKLQRTTQLIFYTAWLLANRDDRPAKDKLGD